MSEYTSNRQRQLKIGISSYTENHLVLDVIGNTNITGVTTLAASGGITTTGGNLYVGKDAYIAGVVTASSFVGSASSLTGIRIGIQSGGDDLGKAETVNFTGTGIASITVSSGIATVDISGGSTVSRLEDLNDVSINNSNKKDKYILMYDAGIDRYILVNPDEVLSASSTTETTQPGLPEDFINQLDTVLDNKIDVDAGTF